MAENAKPRDVQAGWGVFRSSGYSATLEEINRVLSRGGFGTVSPRTYSHYRKLHRYGYELYIPINVLDVETHRSPVWGLPLRSRYRSRSASIDVQILVVMDEGTWSLSGRAVSLSDAEVTLVLDKASSERLKGQVTDIQGLHR